MDDFPTQTSIYKGFSMAMLVITRWVNLHQYPMAHMDPQGLSQWTIRRWKTRGSIWWSAMKRTSWRTTRHGPRDPRDPGRKWNPRLSFCSKGSVWGNFFWTSFTSCRIIRSLAKQTGALQHSQAATTKCISALPAKRRLLISGTPIQNSGLACHLFS